MSNINDIDTETELRNADVPWPKTQGELIDYITKICEDNKGDYGTSVYAMSMSAVAAMHYASLIVGATGFQASCADLDIVRRTRSLQCPFAIIKADDMLYPQYDIKKEVDRLLMEWRPWAKEQAQAKINKNGTAAVEVVRHWLKLVDEVSP